MVVQTGLHILDDAIYNGATTSTLQISNLQLSFNNNLYRVFLKRDGNSCNDTFNVIVLTVDPIPELVTIPEDINRCDSNRDGFIDFDLIVDQTPEILDDLDPTQDTTDFEVFYFSDQADAIANTPGSQLPNPYRVNTSTNSTVYVRIQTINNTTCFEVSEFKIKVTDIPVPTQPIEWRSCDDTASGSDTDTISSFLLNTKDSEILTGVINPVEYRISYHTDPTDAQTSSSSSPIDKNIDYPVTSSQRIYVRIENIDDVNCSVVSDDTTGSAFTSFELIVDPLPVITSSVELKQIS